MSPKRADILDIVKEVMGRDQDTKTIVGEEPPHETSELGKQKAYEK
jgi:hypothetical protein